MSTSYRAPVAAAGATLTEKGSRFLAAVTPVKTESEARQKLSQIGAEWSDATHHCWAFRLGSPALERSSDAGEPRGTAGIPILQVLRGAELCDVLAVVSRWFGGVKLGKGGLARAYAAATRAAVANLVLDRREPIALIRVEVPLLRRGAVLRLLRPPQVAVHSEALHPTALGAVQFLLSVHTERQEAVLAALADLGLAPVRVETGE